MPSKKAIVTGGASGIGLATVRLLSSLGVEVAVNHLPDDSSALRVIDELQAAGLCVYSAPGDVSNQDSVTRFVGDAVQRLGGLDYLVNSAGTSGGADRIPFQDLGAMSGEVWTRVLSTNLTGPFWCASVAADALKFSNGAIVNVASIAGLGRRGSSIAYAASKAALINLTRSLAVALAPEVRVNAVAPGFVNSAWTANRTHETRERARQGSLLERVAEPDDLAEVIVFLLTKASYVNAQTIVVDGGQS
ncbi:3-oxoacyl-[acyl-carrier protein] reductase [Rhizobium sp. PP-F2F-G48]|uniref:SDR family NAD(P)-dependent oxidoreductase n=1 Tax=Rhizobium sp. PP-F2F-G48 TaxID=2135651 RepID=UPI0010E8EEE8|nr:SDR family oxidoreductase [Rhizobium sp. PP-F2F-G48]TCM46517.1 3-oxoacyl-[acyl-carrier protein] reductase [Rhizobium sp. PP-F2F-G48]